MSDLGDIVVCTFQALIDRVLDRLSLICNANFLNNSIIRHKIFYNLGMFLVKAEGNLLRWGSQPRGLFHLFTLMLPLSL